jgi:hypothetical protein
MLIYCFLKKKTIEDVASLVRLSTKTVYYYYQLFRLIVSEIMVLVMTNLKLGGVVEIDEAVITGKRKYNRGRMTRNYWVFGLYSRDLGKGYAFLVPNRQTEILFPIIER